MNKEQNTDTWSIKEVADALEEHGLIREQQPCEDAISRQIISDYVESHIQEINTGYGDLNEHTNRILRMIVGYIESMPSVTPQPKTGHWKRVELGLFDSVSIRWECSECKKSDRFRSNFCFNCGAKMESEG